MLPYTTMTHFLIITIEIDALFPQVHEYIDTLINGKLHQVCSSANCFEMWQDTTASCEWFHTPLILKYQVPPLYHKVCAPIILNHCFNALMLLSIVLTMQLDNIQMSTQARLIPIFNTFQTAVYGERQDCASEVSFLLIKLNSVWLFLIS